MILLYQGSCEWIQSFLVTTDLSEPYELVAIPLEPVVSIPVDMW